jgi:hypothetical protein
MQERNFLTMPKSRAYVLNAEKKEKIRAATVRERSLWHIATKTARSRARLG